MPDCDAYIRVRVLGIATPARRSFVTDRPGDEIKRDPARLAIFKDHVYNIARWLAG